MSPQKNASLNLKLKKKHTLFFGREIKRESSQVDLDQDRVRDWGHVVSLLCANVVVLKKIMGY